MVAFDLPKYAPELRDLEDRKRGEKWARKALDSEAAIVADAANGTRNTTLNIAALKLGHKVASGYLQESEVVTALVDAAQRSGLTQEDGYEAVRATIMSGLVAGMKEPQRPQDRPDYQGDRLGPRVFTAGAKPSLNTFTAASLQDMQFPPIRWGVPDLVPEGLTILAGPPKLGKSGMVLDIGCAIAEGGDTLGKECEQGDVLYLALEDNQRRLKSRLRKILTDENWPAAMTLATQCPRLDQGGLDAIREWIENAGNPRLVVIDTLAMVKPPAAKRGSAYDSDVAALKGLHDLASEKRLSIIVVTHLRKAEADDPVERINSTMGQSGVADTLVVLSRNPAGGAVLYARGRDLAECEHAAELVDCRWVLGGAPIEAGVSVTRRAIFQAVVDGASTTAEVTERMNGAVGANAVRSQLRRMVRAGQLNNPSRGKYAPPVSGVGVQQPQQAQQEGGEL